MKLVEPTDFEILEVLEEHGRNTPKNIALRLDKNRGYINTRLPQLAHYGLVERIGPAENSGLYEITEVGCLAIEHREAYNDTDTDFDALIEEELSSP